MKTKQSTERLLLAVLTILFAWSGAISAQSAHTQTEFFNYVTGDDGVPALKMSLNGHDAVFQLSLMQPTRLFEDACKRLGVEVNNGRANIESLTLGRSLYARNVSVPTMKRPAGCAPTVVGVIGTDMLDNTIVTMDGKNRKVTFSNPYKPSFIKLKNRVRIETQPEECVHLPVTVGGQALRLPVDLTCPALLTLSQADANRLDNPAQTKLTLARTSLNATVAIREQGMSVLGRDLLAHGLLTIDRGKGAVFFQPFDEVSVDYSVDREDTIRAVEGSVTDIGRNYFLTHLWDYTKGAFEVNPTGQPVIIDFWATWCIPCRKLSPLLDQMARKYAGRITFFKVNHDLEKQLSADLGIGALPTLYIIPKNGKPFTVVGPEHSSIEPLMEKLLKD